jgi:citrate lyase beta subunit
MLRKSRRARGSLTARDLTPIARKLRTVNAAIARVFPGEVESRQPVHTVYGGAHLFRADSVRKLGDVALAALDEYAPDGRALHEALQFDSPDGDPLALADTVRARIVEKLRREPVEDFRLDFEDGYGNRPDDEEDGHAMSAAGEVAAGHANGTLPPFIGIRIKPLSAELAGRSLRTLDLFVTTLSSALKRHLPPDFIVTVPKIMAAGQVAAAAAACTALERRLKLRPGAIRLELMIETPQSILGPDGSSALRALVAAGGGRVTGAHFGTYDYTALCGITAAWQHMRHQACDFAKHMMQVALAQSGVMLSDGATSIMPVGPHRASADRPLTDAQRRENREVVHRAWKVHFDDAMQSLVSGYYQGWDLHPAQLPTRYAACTRSFCRRGPRRRRGCATSSTRRRRPPSSATCSTTRRRGRDC